MITHILSIADPGEDAYDDLYPTKQTETLCLELRKILYGLNGATIRHAETTDLDELETVVDGLLTSFEASESDAVTALEGSLPVPLPTGMPDIIGDLSGLVLAGVANPLVALGVKVLLPVVGRLIARKMGVPGYSGQEDISGQLTAIADRIAGEGGDSVAALINQIKDVLDEVLIDSQGSIFKVFESGEDTMNGTSVFCGVTALGERLSALVRIVEELQSIMESKAVSIMHTSESDKVVYITD